MVEFIVEADKLVNMDGFKRGRFAFAGVSKSSGVSDDTAGSLPVGDLPMVRIISEGLSMEH